MEYSFSFHVQNRRRSSGGTSNMRHQHTTPYTPPPYFAEEGTGSVDQLMERRRHSMDGGIRSEAKQELSTTQKQGCLRYIQRRHSMAMAFASMEKPQEQMDFLSNNSSHWEFLKTKYGIDVYKSKRSRCEIRSTTKVYASVKNVMSLLAPSEDDASNSSSINFYQAQRILLGEDQLIDAKCLSSCLPSTPHGSSSTHLSQRRPGFFHCGLKYMAMKNPFGVHPLDFVFLDYTDVHRTEEGHLVGYRIMESIRVPEFQMDRVRSIKSKMIRGSIRCEVYIVRETDTPGVVEVTFASHVDPKSKYSSSKKNYWLEQAITRLLNLRTYAEKASFSHHVWKNVVPQDQDIPQEVPQEAQEQECATPKKNCFICDQRFHFLLKKKHQCRLCGDISCGKCSRKIDILGNHSTSTDPTSTLRVRVCLYCIIMTKKQPDEVRGSEIHCAKARRESFLCKTYIAYDEKDQNQNQKQHQKQQDQEYYCKKLQRNQTTPTTHTTSTSTTQDIAIQA